MPAFGCLVGSERFTQTDNNIANEREKKKKITRKLISFENYLKWVVFIQFPDGVCRTAGYPIQQLPQNTQKSAIFKSFRNKNKWNIHTDWVHDFLRSFILLFNVVWFE